MKHKIILMSASLLLGFSELKAQSIGPRTFNASGGSGTIAATTFDWSIGEMTLVSTYSSSSLVVTQGTLQPLVNNLGVASAELEKNIQVFPNPANSVLNIQFTAQGEGVLNYKLMDVAGRILMEQEMAVKQGTNTQQLDMASLAAATYMLQVSSSVEGKTGATSYKIQKLK